MLFHPSLTGIATFEPAGSKPTEIPLSGSAPKISLLIKLNSQAKEARIPTLLSPYRKGPRLGKGYIRFRIVLQIRDLSRVDQSNLTCIKSFLSGGSLIPAVLPLKLLLCIGLFYCFLILRTIVRSSTSSSILDLRFMLPYFIECGICHRGRLVFSLNLFFQLFY